MPIFPQSIASKHYMVLNAPKFGNTPSDLNFELKFTGAALLDFKGNPDGTWRHEVLQISNLLLGMDKILERVQPFIPPLSPIRLESYQFVPIQWTVHVGLNAIFDANDSVNAGFAVDNFSLMSEVSGSIRLMNGIQADIAVRDKDGMLLRIGYQACVYGYFVAHSKPLVIKGG